MGAAARVIVLLVAASMLAPVTVKASDLPGGFVYLSDIAPEIRQDIRYAGSRNFTGGKVPGYSAPECVLAGKAALALKAVHKALSSRGFGLLVLDCYRPKKAVRHFVVWAESRGGRDPGYHPRVDRKSLIAGGYIARRSGHSNGYTVDLTLTDSTGVELDMGTPFDFFDPLAQTGHKNVPAAMAQRRNVLVTALAESGFVNYSREWWHFSLKSRPAGLRSHDFDIVPRGR